jgi:hypothetical protein
LCPIKRGVALDGFSQQSAKIKIYSNRNQNTKEAKNSRAYKVWLLKSQQDLKLL